MIRIQLALCDHFNKDGANMYTKLISRRILSSAAGLTLLVTCLAAGQQRSAEGKTAEQVYKNIKVLNGIPADQVTPTMRLIARSLGVTCEFCHDAMDRSKDGLEAKETARKMIKMVRDINTNSFGGRPQVACNTCHNGHNENARASCANCHPALSNCGRDVEKMDTTFADPKSTHNIHWVKCADCHDHGIPKSRKATLYQGE